MQAQDLRSGDACLEPGQRGRVPDSQALHAGVVALLDQLDPGVEVLLQLGDTDSAPIESEERGKEQCNVVFGMNHHVGCGVRVHGAYHRIEWTDEDPEVPDMIPGTYDVDVISGLRISMYGAWGRRGLAAALREAAAMLDGADDRLPEVKGPGA